MWEYFDRIPNKKGFIAHCKKCNNKIHGHIDRMARHIDKCSGIIEDGDTGRGNGKLTFSSF